MFTLRNSEFPPWNFLYNDSDYFHSYDYYYDHESYMIIITITNGVMIMITMLTMFINCDYCDCRNTTITMTNYYFDNFLRSPITIIYHYYIAISHKSYAYHSDL